MAGNEEGGQEDNNDELKALEAEYGVLEMRQVCFSVFFCFFLLLLTAIIGE
jgi:hypothetical protein